VFGQPQLIIARPKRTFRVPSESRAWNRSSGSLYIGIGTVKPSNGRLPPLAYSCSSSTYSSARPSRR
jgi:hypothetical protein